MHVYARCPRSVVTVTARPRREKYTTDPRSIIAIVTPVLERTTDLD